jgi:hypothetical protein
VNMKRHRTPLSRKVDEVRKGCLTPKVIRFDVSRNEVANQIHCSSTRCLRLAKSRIQLSRVHGGDGCA